MRYWQISDFDDKGLAPLLDNQIDLSYNIIRFNGSFMKENVYRQAAGPEVDAAWEALGVNCEHRITPEKPRCSL